VPCACNFGEGPSPHHYCYSVFSLDIEKGRYGSVQLAGLHLVVAHAQASRVVYLDDQATPEQTAAARAIATRILRGHSFSGPFETAHITQEIGDRSARVQVGVNGGFETDYIIGGDGKTPRGSREQHDVQYSAFDENEDQGVPLQGRAWQRHRRERHER